MRSRLKNLAVAGGIVLATSLAAPVAHAAPTEKIIYNFGVVAGGRNPQSPLTLGSDGAYYGTTTGGGATGNGTVYRLTPPASGQAGWQRQVIHAFSGVADGSVPSSGVLIGRDGALYGLTATGGAHAGGVAYRLSPPTPEHAGWTLTTLHDFAPATDGNAPSGTLVADAEGVLYGTTNNGGAGGGGVVFSLAPPASGQSGWTLSVLHGFVFGADGIFPSGGVYRDAASGALYGMTSGGGLAGFGEIYRLTPPPAGGAWTKSDLYSFRAISDGNVPVGNLVRDDAGVFYGLTDAGGLTGWGTVFSFVPPQPGKPAVERILYHFSGGLDGGAPDATPVLAPDGTLYGVTNAGGSVGSGTAFSLTPPTHGDTWTERALASFTGPNGVNPAALTLDPTGFLLGVTFYGGTVGDGGGTIFTLTPPAAGGTDWTQTVLFSLPDNSADASSPLGPLLAGANGVNFGTAYAGGAYGQGAVYSLTPPAAGQTGWTRTLLHSFTGTDGAQPTGALLQDARGVLYGVTSSGGPNGVAGYGTVFSLTPPNAAGGGWTQQVLHAFGGVVARDGSFPAAGLVGDARGALYGTAGSGGLATSDDPYGNGVVFKLVPPANGQGGWTETILHAFAGPDGSTPQDALLPDGHGGFYGTTYTGGAAGEGAVFQLTPPAAAGGSWAETVLHSFDASTGSDGAIPGTGQLVRGAGGTLFGTASQGGQFNYGAVFALAPPASGASGWTETLLHSFTLAEGGSPYPGLLANKAGALFGTTQTGGPFQLYGMVYKLAPPAAPGAAWKLTVLHDFDPLYGQDGFQPAAALVHDAHGDLFGTTAAGGHGGGGIVFELTP